MHIIKCIISVSPDPELKPYQVLEHLGKSSLQILRDYLLPPLNDRTVYINDLQRNVKQIRESAYLAHFFLSSDLI